MFVEPLVNCPFCNKALKADKKHKKILIWSDCENDKCNSHFMQYSYIKNNCVILWKFNLNIKNYSSPIKIDFHFPVNKSSDCGILGYKKNESGASSILFEIDSVFVPDFTNIDNLKNKIESLIMFA